MPVEGRSGRRKKTAGGKQPRKPAGGKRQGKPDADLKATLEGLRDALDLTLTRIIEDDMSVEEARGVLGYLEKELSTFEADESKVTPPRRKGSRRRT